MLSQPTPPEKRIEKLGNLKICFTQYAAKVNFENVDYLPLDVTSAARFSCNKSATICFISTSSFLALYLFIYSYIHYTASSLLFFSQIPSHPISMKSTPFSRSNSYVSGLAVIACSSGFRCSRCLYLRSPRLRVRFRLPSTRPSVMVEPDLVILSISV